MGACCSAITIQKLLAQCAAVEQRFDFVDLDAFGAPMALVPWALEAVRFGGIFYLASTDGRSFTGHDRTAALRRLGLPRGRSPAVGSWLAAAVGRDRPQRLDVGARHPPAAELQRWAHVSNRGAGVALAGPAEEQVGAAGLLPQLRLPSRRWALRWRELGPAAAAPSL